MGKDAYFFSHDSNAKDDPKCVMLIEQLGLEGYGIYWVLIETLRDQPGYKYPVALISALARRYNTTGEKMKAVINGYGLFVVDENDFFSLSLIQRMEKWELKREHGRKAGIASAKKRAQLNAGSTIVQQPSYDRSTTVQPLREEKIREEEKKEEETIEEKSTGGDTVYSLYQKEIGLLTGITAETLADDIEHYGDEWVRKAISIAAINGKRNAGYVNGILRSWWSGGYRPQDKPWEQEKKPVASKNDNERNEMRKYLGLEPL